VSPSIDEAGEELANDEAAWRLATIIAGEIFKDIDGKFRLGQKWALEVAGEARKTVYFIDIQSRQAK
jgi:hypothetical protein